MAHKLLAAAMSMIVAIPPVSAANSKPAPPAIAPTESAGSLYCMRVEPFTGSRIETVRCWTRQEWADQGVDVDKDWAKEGVRVIG